MTKPGAPSDFKARAVGSSVILTWSPSANVPTKYAIHRGTSATNLEQIDEVDAAKTNYTDDNLEARTYFYKIVATNADGSSESPVRSADATQEAIQLGLWSFVGYLIVVVVGLGLAALLVPFPTIGADASLAQISGSVGAYLVRFGVVLLVVAFVPALVELLARTFRIKVTLPKFLQPKDGKQAVEAEGGLTELVLGLVGQFPDLLRRPAGYGIAAMLLGVVLLVGAAFGFGDEEPAASPSLTPSISTPAPETPEPGASPT